MYQIVNEGKHKKFISDIEHITFSGEYAKECCQEVLYITERAVFKLTPKGLELIEIAPGVDAEKDIIHEMDFRPVISKDLKPMQRKIFLEGKMGI